MKLTFNSFLCAVVFSLLVVIVIPTIYHYTIRSNDRIGIDKIMERNRENINQIGVELIVDDDTVEIVDYIREKQIFVLSNGKEIPVSFLYILKNNNKMKHSKYKIGKLIFIDKTKMTLNEWISFRRLGVGGSDVSSILDLNPYATITELYMEKIGYRDPEDLSGNENVFWGNMHEDQIHFASRYYDLNSEERTNYLYNHSVGNVKNDILKMNFIVKHEDYPWLIMNLDGIEFHDEDVTQESLDEGIRNGVFPTPRRVHEFKHMSGYTSDKWELGLPIGYISQVTTYCVPFKHLNNHIDSVIWSLKDGNMLEPHIVPWSETFTNSVIDRSREFWDTVKQGKIILNSGKSVSEIDNELTELAPRPENITANYDEFLSKKLKERAEMTIAGGDEIKIECIKYKSLTRIKSLIEEKISYRSAIIKEFMDLNKAKVLTWEETGEKISWNRRFFMSKLDDSEVFEDSKNGIVEVLDKFDLS